MKILLPVLLLFISIAFTNAQAFSSALPTTDSVSNDVATESGANYRIWARTNYETAATGVVTPHVHQYTELASGLNYKDSQTGEWRESKDEIDILPTGGAAATNGQHKAYFPADIYSDEIRVVTPSGQILRSRPLGLSYTDGANTILISELKDSIGELVGSNKVVYPDAFTAFKADLCYTYTKHGFEQDVILREAPPGPQTLGLNPGATRLQVLTEFFSAPQPVLKSTTLAPQAGLALMDQSLDFGSMKMVRGRAFFMGNATRTNNLSAFVGKHWMLLDGRQILVEEVPIGAIANQLTALPLAVASRSTVAVPRVAAGHLVLPPQRLAVNASSNKKTKMLAKAELPQSGFVLDYQAVNSGFAGYTFKGDTTYYVGDEVDIDYDTVTFEGGTVIKYSNSSTAQIFVFQATAVCQTGPYRPAVFTSMDDDSVGEMINGSSHSPVNTGATYLTIDDYGSPDPAIIKYLRFSYAGTALYYEFSQNPCPVQNCQFVNCGEALLVTQASQTSPTKPLALFNDLFSRCSYGVNSSCDVIGANITADQIDDFADFESSQYFTNCIFTAVPDVYDQGVLDHCTQESSGVGIYGTTLAGHYYLANGWGLSNPGTPNIDPTFLSSLKQKTTQRPIVYVGVFIATNLTLSPQITRDTNSNPGRGYHYDPIDYLLGSVQMARATLTINPGTTIAVYSTSANGYGLGITDFNTQVICQGAADNLNRIVEISTVQEQSSGWINPAEAVTDTGHAAIINFGFTDWSVMADDYFHLKTYESSLIVQNNQFHGGQLQIWGTMGVETLNLTNCLLERVGADFRPGNGLTVANATFWGGSLISGTTHGISLIENSLFDSTVPGTAIAYDANHNAYGNALTYDSGIFGNYYLPSISPLINAGSQSATQAGLAYFTTQKTGPREGTSPSDTVDIGYHYAIDSNSDGIPDYWAVQYGFNPDITVSQTDPNDLLGPIGDPDGDGVDNYHEYLNGTSPVRPNSQNITIGGYTYKTFSSALAGTGKVYDVYYRRNLSAQWRRISSTAPGQKLVSFVNPNPTSEGDYIFLNAADADGDGLSDGYENWFTYTDSLNHVVRSNPNQPDSDGDEMYDGWEVQYALNPMSASSPNGRLDDPDGDGLSNQSEHDDYDFVDRKFNASYDPEKNVNTQSSRPLITVSQSAANAFEMISFTITRYAKDGDTSPYSGDLMVYYAVGGTLTYETDYTLNPAPVDPSRFSATIPNGQPSVTITISVTPGGRPASNLAITLLSFASVQ